MIQEKSNQTILPLLVLLTLLSPISSSINPPNGWQPRVVGGTEVTPAFKYPWMVALAQQNSLLCGGTLLSPSYILTAAHCSVELPPSVLSAHLHRHDLSLPESQEEGFGRTISKVIVHPEYNPETQENDFAVWKLSEPVQGLQAVSWDQVGGLEVTGTPALVMGWGTTEYQGTPSSVLLEATVEVWDFASCNAQWGDSLNPAVQLCAGLPNGGKDTCQGDSGGPILVEDGNGTLIQIGIVSFGKGCAEPNTPGVYSYVYGGRDFIQNAQDDSKTNGCSNDPCPAGSFCVASIGTHFCNSASSSSSSGSSGSSSSSLVSPSLLLLPLLLAFLF